MLFVRLFDLCQFHLIKNTGLDMWAIHYRAEKGSQSWTILDTFDKRVDAVITAYQVSNKYFMVKIIDPDGNIAWST